MPVEIKLPQLGESIHEGTIARWLKQPGDRVAKYEPLVEITTDKVNVEMPSPVAGMLVALLVPEGETRPVGSPIALVELEGAAATEGAAAADARQAQGPGREAPATPAAGAGMPAPAAASPTAARDRGGARLSPLVLRLAREHGIPLGVLETLPGSGAGGRVTKDDVLRYVAQRAAAPAAGIAAPAPAPAPGAPSGDRLVKLTPIRRAIAQRMAQSKREIPHAYGVIEVDMSAVVAWREAHKEAWRREGVPLTYTAFFIRAAVDALRAYPVVNAAWTDEGILLRGTINIGVGIAIDDGLVVPVLREADRLSLRGVAAALDDLTRRARAGQLTLDDIQGGTFTITNPGVFGSIWSMPIIVPGQAAILATDAIVKRAVVRDDAIAIRPIMHLGLSFDHRVFDGAVGMQFLQHLKAWFEGFRDAG
ncbi:MAG: dihydrolipoamide acetyltransferase family protein [Armatimonadota bacterium]|nr:dihydrolipoamide acetyltransferase family protein [Armatimonadota bacterium]MDR7533453.1 dihydrolipoamide acetyltransferase family protein [Armatimonadota bacterium]MDR7536266.1 dihydrolipoamide acetyltransferase family protein [Armatimonadota bacterium]